MPMVVTSELIYEFRLIICTAPLGLAAENEE